MAPVFHQRRRSSIDRSSTLLFRQRTMNKSTNFFKSSVGVKSKKDRPQRHCCCCCHKRILLLYSLCGVVFVLYILSVSTLFLSTMMKISPSSRLSASTSSSSAAVNASTTIYLVLLVVVAVTSSNPLLTPVQALVPLRRNYKKSSTLVRPINYQDSKTTKTTKLNNRFQDNYEDEKDDDDESSSSSYLSKRQRLRLGFQRDM